MRPLILTAHALLVLSSLAACDVKVDCPDIKAPYVQPDDVYDKYDNPPTAREDCAEPLPPPKLVCSAEDIDCNPTQEAEQISGQAPGPEPEPEPEPKTPERPQPDTYGQRHGGAGEDAE